MRIPTPSGDIAIDRTRSGKIRLARQLEGQDAYFMLTRADARAVAAGILRVLEDTNQAATSIRLDVAPPMSIIRQRGGLRLSRTFFGTGEEVWMSASESAACDIAIALVEQAGTW